MKNLNTIEISNLNTILASRPQPLYVEANDGWTSSGESQILVIRPVNEDTSMKFIPILHTAELQEGLTPSQIAQKIAEAYTEELHDVDFDAGQATSRDYILSHVQVRMIRDEKAQYARQHGIILVPVIGEIYAYFAVILKDTPDDGGDELISYSLDYKALDATQITIDELVAAAKKIAREQVTMQSIEDVLGLGSGDLTSTFYVVSNTRRHYGASVLMLDDVLKQIALKLGDTGYSIIPSSVHEILVVPDSLNIPDKELRDMLIDVNSSIVRDDEVLSNHTLRFEHGKLTVTD